MDHPASPPASTARPTRWFRLVAILASVLVVGAAGWWWYRDHATGGTPAASGGGRMRGGGGPATVSVAGVKAGELRIERTALGTVTALSTVTIRTQISGRLERLHFTEGQLVAAGDLLAEIDDRPFALALAQYQGQLVRDEALLKQAGLDLARYQTLVEQDSLPRQQRETQESLVSQLRGTVASDQAQIGTTQLNLSYCRITAPTAGQVGLRLVDAGNYVTPGDASGLMSITQVTPISVLFSLPEIDVPLVVPEVRAGRTLTVQILDRDGVRELATGTLATVDNAIDPTTGTLRMRALVANDDHRLFPNQFVNVRVQIQVHKAAAVVPLAAMQRNTRGTYAWVVAEGVAQMRPVRAGIEAGDQVEVLDGLVVGEQVVIDGVDRLREGAAVAVGSGDHGAGEHGAGHSGEGKPREHKRREGEAEPSADGQPREGGKRRAAEGDRPAAAEGAGGAPAPVTSPTTRP